MKTASTILILILLHGLAPGQQICTKTYTLDADFDKGTFQNVHHNAPNNNQLQLDGPYADSLLPFIWLACSGRGTVVRVDVNTGEVLGEYHSAPGSRAKNPSRTTVDYFGNVWVTNRNELNVLPPGGTIRYGSVVKIGLVIGGTRVDQQGNPDPNGAYLKPPFEYCTAVDRDGDGLIRTSRGLGDILPWPDVTDGVGGEQGLVEDADDECILVYQRTPNAINLRHCSVDPDNNIWVGPHPNSDAIWPEQPKYWFHKLDNLSGEILQSFDAK